MSTAKKIFVYTLAAIFGLALIALSAAYILLRGSLPHISGEQNLSELTAQVTIERDDHGIPTITARNRLDVARAIGFIHAQERFFQMDLMRRAAAGELSELFGSAALDFDKKRRLHQIRTLSNQIFDQLDVAQRDLLIAYSQGVNRGLGTLAVRPFEYLFLTAQPASWQPQDTLLVSFGLFFELQEEDGISDLTRGHMKALLPEPVYNFFVNNGTAWDSAIDGSRRPILPIPSAQDFSYLKKSDAETEKTIDITDPVSLGGSNNWAVAGSRTEDGQTLLACDMHLRLATPNIWYRASFNYRDGEGKEVAVTGVTLPGAPCMVIGSNGNIAWGFTNSFVDTTDLIIIKADESDPERYLTAEGPLKFTREIEEIKVKGEAPVPYEIKKTIWGPISRDKLLGKPLAIQWTAHIKEALNMRVVDLETAHTVTEALEAIKHVKIPTLNFVVADDEGHIAWTLVGAIPNRIGFDGTVPVSYDDGERKWEGLVNADNYPVVVDPTQGFVWTANNRVFGDEWLPMTNQEGHLNSIRAYQIQTRLENTQKATAKEMLDIQLDTEALFFVRWQKLLIETLQKAPTTPQYAKLLGVIQAWDKHASADSAAYYWIRRFRDVTMQHVLARFLAPCCEAWPEFTHTSRDFEEPLWLLVSQQPDYLANPAYGSWNKELTAYVQHMLDEDLPKYGSIEDALWGAKTVLQMQHPFCRSMPFLQTFLDMPHEPMSGDIFMPKVAGPHSGASQRMVVSPGNEKAGIFHAPGGQSGHPLSKHYSDGHAAWAKGVPTSFLPGATVETLILIPR